MVSSSVVRGWGLCALLIVWLGAGCDDEASRDEDPSRPSAGKSDQPVLSGSCEMSDCDGPDPGGTCSCAPDCGASDELTCCPDAPEFCLEDEPAHRCTDGVGLASTACQSSEGTCAMDLALLLGCYCECDGVPGVVVAW